MDYPCACLVGRLTWTLSAVVSLLLYHRWVRNFEKGLMEAYERFRRGDAPADIQVADVGVVSQPYTPLAKEAEAAAAASNPPPSLLSPQAS